MQPRLTYLLFGLAVWFFCSVDSISADIECSFIVDYISANNNTITQIRQEVALLKGNFDPKGESDSYTFDFNVSHGALAELSISSHKLDQKRAQFVLNAIKQYVIFRLEGHSRQYSCWMVMNHSKSWPRELQAKAHRCKKILSEVAFPWVEPDIVVTLAFPLMREDAKSTPLYVVDGDLAWVYVIPKIIHSNDVAYVNVCRFDAIEFHPAIKTAMQSVFSESLKNGQVPTEERLLKSSWWFDLAERIKNKTGIVWRTPVELNPQTTYD